MPSQNFQRRVTSVIITNVCRVLPVLSTRPEQERGTFLRVLAKLQRTKGVTRVGVEIRERLKKGSSAEEKPRDN